MRYFAFIDESGPFDEGITRKVASLVGGVCGVLDDAAWDAVHRQQLVAFGRGSRIRFAYPDHYHCGKLLEGRLRPPGPVSRRDIESFTDNVFATACRSAAFVFASKNTGKRFESSPQATYVLNLVAATRKAVESLGTLCLNADSVEIVVAQRTISETVNSTYPDYMPRMLDYIKEQLLAGESPSVAFARRLDAEGRLSLRWAVGDRNAGLIAADFVSCLLRGGKRPPDGSAIVWTHPNEVMFGDYRRYYDQEVLRLLKQKQYATAADVLRRYFPTSDGHPDYAVLVHALRKEDDCDVLMRELSSLLVLARFLINRRTQEPGNLGCAQELLTQLVKIAETRLTERSGIGVERAWACLLVDGLADLAACHNHLGDAVGPQQDIEARLSTLLTTHKDLLPGSHTSRKERLLDIRNRNMNQLFNDFRFAEVLAVFSGEVERREAEIPEGEPDDLLGQMQGSMGQACAFLARTDTTWTGLAREYFEKSIKNFRTGTAFQEMAVNFLVTLAWQEGNLHLACREMTRHICMPDTLSPEAVVNDFGQFLAGRISPFDAVNLCRIAAATALTGNPPELSAITATWDHWSGRMVDAHPHEQLCKWLAILAMCRGNHLAAIQMLARASNISATLGFTVKTIRLSILGVHAVAAGLAEDNHQYAQLLNAFRECSAELSSQSAPFAAYIAGLGGADGLSATIKERSITAAWELASFLPFNYA